MQLLKTLFALRSDLRWSEDVYEKCIYAWIFESEDRKNHRKNYANLLEKLPPKIDFGNVSEQTFSSPNESLKYSAFSVDGFDYLAFFFAYRNDGRKWEVVAAFKRTQQNVLCFVSLNCELGKGQALPAISKPRLLDKLLQFQEGVTEISKSAHIISNTDIHEAVGILKNGPAKDTFLPVVYLSCSEGTHSLKPRVLAEKLFGVAHVYAEENRNIYDRLKLELEGVEFPRRGEIGIYYAGLSIQILNRYASPEWKARPERLVQEIFAGILKRSLSAEFPFSTVEFLKAQEKFRSLHERLVAKKKSEFKEQKNVERILQKIRELTEENGRLKSENETLNVERKSVEEDFLTLEATSIENEKRLNEDLKSACQNLYAAKAEIESLREKFKPQRKKNDFLPLLRPDEEEMFPDETLCHLVSWLKILQGIVPKSKISPESRSNYLLEKILEANSAAQELYARRNTEMEKLEKAAENQELYKSESQLKSFGMKCEPKGNGHSKIYFLKDKAERFLGTESSSPSDRRHGGKNQASEIFKAMLWKNV